MKWLVTGAAGFVGQALVARLTGDPANTVCATTRSPGAPLAAGVARTVMAELGSDTDWLHALQGVEVVVHLAARVHVMRERSGDPLAAFRRVNVQGSLHLARQAAALGVRRFVFVSSVKVHGETTRAGIAFRADDPPRPEDAYGQSKQEAEAGLRELARSSGMQVVIVRPPLVYGPGVRGNFLALMQALARGWPLPLGAIHNQRSFVALDNLLDLLVLCARHPAAANQSFLVSDGQDLSTPELLRHMAHAMGRPARLWPVPVPLLLLAGRMTGRADSVRRLCGNLQVDISKTRDVLGWVPPVGVDAALRQAVLAAGLARV